jgi:hypothetical protein
MSITVDYFFNHQDELSSVARKISEWLGCYLAPYDARHDDLFCRFLGMELTLSKHTFENDGELDFENYMPQHQNSNVRLGPADRSGSSDGSNRQYFVLPDES